MGPLLPWAGSAWTSPVLPSPPQFSPVLPGHQEGAGDAGLGLGPTRVSELELGAGLLAQWSGWDGRSVVRTEPD